MSDLPDNAADVIGRLRSACSGDVVIALMAETRIDVIVTASRFVDANALAGALDHHEPHQLFGV